MEMEKKKKVQASALLIIGMITVMSASSLFQNALAEENNLNVSDFLQVSENIASEYYFTAGGQCVLACVVKDATMTFLTLDGTLYQLSYGYNAFGVEMGEDFTLHHLTLENPEYFSQLYVQKLILSQSILQLTDDNANTQEIPFKAGGLVHFLIRNDFHRDDLRLVVDGLILKDFHPHNPLTDSLILTLEQLAFLEYSLEVSPGEHIARIEGKEQGNVQIFIFNNFDYDNDFLETAKEIKLNYEEGSYNQFNFNPIYPNLWGFLERGSDSGLNAENLDFELNLFIPNSNAITNFLYLNVIDGIVTNLMIDDDTLTYRTQDFTIGNNYITNMAPGYHKIIGKVSGEYYKIEFYLNLEKVPIIFYPEFSDLDADGLKNSAEINSGLNLFKPDTDGDGIIDGYDQSPLSKLELPVGKIFQVAIPTLSERTTSISLQLKKPIKDHTSNRRMWRDTVEISVIPAVRVFGSLTMDLSQLETYVSKTAMSYNLANDPAYELSGNGDAVPDDNNPVGNFTIVPIKYSDSAWDANIIYPANHLAKTGANSPGTLDLRLDFVWMVLQKDPKTGNASLLHYYPIAEPITIAAMTIQEIGQINYAYATPDTFIEHKIIDALVENPTLLADASLNAFSQYGVKDDIIAFGTGTYDWFINDLSESAKDISILPNQNQVLYCAGMARNIDVLNRINVLQNNPDDPETANEGEYDTTFTFNTIYNDVQKIDTSIISSGEYRIVEAVYNSKIEGNPSQLIVKDRTIGINIRYLGGGYSTVEFTKAYGGPFNFIDIKNQRENTLDSHLRILHDTYMELDQFNPSINPPSLKDH